MTTIIYFPRMRREIPPGRRDAGGTTTRAVERSANTRAVVRTFVTGGTKTTTTAAE
jgi:hypothetical protein